MTFPTSAVAMRFQLDDAIFTNMENAFGLTKRACELANKTGKVGEKLTGRKKRNKKTTRRRIWRIGIFHILEKIGASELDEGRL